jgi:hypothetical protein
VLSRASGRKAADYSDGAKCEISDELLFGGSSVRESQHLLLTRPCDRCIEEAGDTDPARKPTIDSRFDEAWREESQ